MCTSNRASYQRVTLLDVQDVPQINQNSDADSDHCEDAIDLRAPCTSHEETGGNKPAPPFDGEFPAESQQPVNVAARHVPVPQLAESNVRVNSQRHEEYERRIEENEAGLRDMGVI